MTTTTTPTSPRAAPASKGASGQEQARAPERILVCDDEELIRWSVTEHLRSEGFTVSAVKNGEECLNAAIEHAPDAILLDLKMPVMDGLTCLRKLREHGLSVPVVVLTAHGAIETAIESTRLGASAYLSKPFDLREVTIKLRQAIDADRMSEEVKYLRDRWRAHYGSLVGQSPAMHVVFDMMRKLEGVDAPTVLISGESGTGKELVAQAIHANGPRKDAPFVEIDCASLPETLIESELFGHERGAFTDARQLKRGLLEVGRGGTIFLDEIGEMSLATQARFLRALESRRFKRVGGVVDLPVDAGIIAASNRDLAREVEKGRFRQDLYYRLAVIPLELPPLRARTGDVPYLVSHFLEQFRKRIPGRLEGVDAAAMAALTRYSWPGNVRELRNVIERIVTLYRDDAHIELQHLPAEIRYASERAGEPPAALSPAAAEALAGVGGPHHAGGAGGSAAAAGGASGGFLLPTAGVDLEQVERGFVVQALERTSKNQTAAAKLLGISRYALRHRMEKFGLKEEK